MIQTVIMFAAAINLIVVACLISARAILHIVFIQILPVSLAIGLSVFAFARVMGWPI